MKAASVPMSVPVFRSYKPARPMLRYDNGAEVCECCGGPTREKLLAKGRRNQREVLVECPTCGWTRPAA